jgi:hypothetical protein
MKSGLKSYGRSDAQATQNSEMIAVFALGLEITRAFRIKKRSQPMISKSI